MPTKADDSQQSGTRFAQRHVRRHRIEQTSKRYQAANWLLALAGLRASELCGLRVMDIDWEQRTLTVNEVQMWVKGGGVGRGRKGLPTLHEDVRPLPNYLPKTYRSMEEIDDAVTHTWVAGMFHKDDVNRSSIHSHVRSDAVSNKENYRPFDPNDPFPIDNVIYYWNITYFYYGRSRQERGSGLGIPRLRTEFTAYSAVHIDIIRRHVVDAYDGSFVRETHNHQKSPSHRLTK